MEELIKMTNKNHTRKNCSGACTSMANEGTVLNTRSSETFKIQGLITTIQELRKIANQLDKEVKDNEEKYKAEQSFMENCLNMKHSGYDWRMVFFFYVLGRRWNVNKLNYYLKMLGASKTGNRKVKK